MQYFPSPIFAFALLLVALLPATTITPSAQTASDKHMPHTKCSRVLSQSEIMQVWRLPHIENMTKNDLPSQRYYIQAHLYMRKPLNT